MPLDGRALHTASLAGNTAGLLRALSTYVEESGGILLSDRDTTLRRTESRFYLASAEGMGLSGPAPEGTHFAAARRSRGGAPFNTPLIFPDDIGVAATRDGNTVWHEGLIRPSAPPPPPVVLKKRTPPRWFLLFNGHDSALEHMTFAPLDVTPDEATALRMRVPVPFRFNLLTTTRNLHPATTGLSDIRAHWRPEKGFHLLPLHPGMLDTTATIRNCPSHPWCLSSPIGAMFAVSHSLLANLCNVPNGANWFMAIIDELIARFTAEADKLTDQKAMLKNLGIDGILDTDASDTPADPPPPVTAIPPTTIDIITRAHTNCITRVKQDLGVRLADATAHLAAVKQEHESLGDPPPISFDDLFAGLKRAQEDGVIRDYGFDGTRFAVLFDDLVTSITEEDLELIRKHRGDGDILIHNKVSPGTYRLPPAVLYDYWNSGISSDAVSVQLVNGGTYPHPHNMNPPCIGHGSSTPINKAILRRLRLTDIYGWLKWWRVWLLTSNLEAGYDHVVARHYANGTAARIADTVADTPPSPVAAAPGPLKLTILSHIPPDGINALPLNEGPPEIEATEHLPDYDDEPEPDHTDDEDQDEDDDNDRY